jgi:hypothetical protein
MIARQKELARNFLPRAVSEYGNVVFAAGIRPANTISNRTQSS